MADRYWEQITTPEGAKHRRLTVAVKDGDQAVPTRYQTTTDDEAYQGFKETCSEEVESIMLMYSEQQKEKYSKRQDSESKEYRMKYATEVLPKKFPSKTWFLQQHPSEVKMLHDHTTGLCKVSFSIKIIQNIVPWYLKYFHTYIYYHILLRILNIHL